MPVWKKLFFGLATCGLFFVALELLLALAGVGAYLSDEDPFVGFESKIPLLQEETRPDGTISMATARNKLAWFNEQQFPKTKPKGTYRIFCVGGSTTFGRPYEDSTSFSGWLRELLPAADPSKNWEVINAGGISYASYRVTVVMEELAQYEPDLFIIYSGHNEFLEHRTYRTIRDTSSWTTGIVSLLGRTRVYTALKWSLDEVRGGAAPTEHDRYHLPGEVDPILEHTLGPTSYHRDDVLRQQIIEHYRLNLVRMLDIARSSGADAMLVTPASNLRDFSPFKSEHKAGLSEVDKKRWETLYKEAQRKEKNGQWSEALAVWEEAEAIDDRYAELFFRQGSALYELGKYEEAKSAFLRARDEDVCPLRALTPMVQAVREVAADHGVSLIDFERIIDERSEHSLPGKPHFLDHVHPTIAANRLLARRLIDAMVTKGVVRPTPSWGEEAVATVVQDLEKRVDAESHAMALLNLAKVLTWAGKFEESHGLAQKASNTLVHNPECYYILAVIAENRGDTGAALEHYREATRLMPDYVRAHHNLGVLLDKQGNLEEAIFHYRETLRIKPDHAGAHTNLANALAEQGDTPEAISHYREALRIKPDLAEAHNNLGVQLVELGKSQEAISHYREALRVQPGYAEAHNNLGLLLASKGDTEDAVAHFEAALRAKPDYMQAHLNLANMLAGQARLSEAITHYREALHLQPTSADAHYNLAVVLAAQRDLPAAEGHYRAALRLNSDLADAHNNLGTILAAQGRLAEAHHHFSEAVRLDPDLASARENLKRIKSMHQNGAQPIPQE